MGVRAAHHRKVPRQRHRMIVPQRKLLPALVHQIENQLRILAVLARENIFALKHGRVKAAPAIRRETVLHDPVDMLAAVHLSWAVVARSLPGEKAPGLSIFQTIP